MSEPGNQVVERYMRAFPTEFGALGALRHPDYVEDWPQSGERIRGHENYVRIHQRYPGGLPEAETRRIVGSEDRWVMSPSFTLVRIVGAGDSFTVEGSLRYPKGASTHLVAILEVRDGKVARATHTSPTRSRPRTGERSGSSRSRGAEGSIETIRRCGHVGA